MARRLDDRFIDTVYDALLATPWWVGPIMAGCTYAFLRWAIPSVAPSHPTLDAFYGNVFPLLAFVFTAVIMFAWVMSLITKFRRARLLDSQPDIETLRQMSWEDFERLVGEYFRRKGYTVVEKGGSSPDGGIDLDLWRGGQRWVVQCKHWRSKSVGVEAIRAFYGVLVAENAAGGFFVATGTFTRPAQEFAINRIELIDGNRLWEGIENIRPVATPSPAPLPRAVTNDEISNDASAVDQTDPPPCPKCGDIMIKRTARRGAKAGTHFYGCTRFPKCRGTREMATPSN